MYQKEIIYMGLYKDGGRLGSAGFLKVENRDRESRLSMKIQNLPYGISGRFPIRVYNGNDWKEINGITIQDGGGKWEENLAENVDRAMIQVMLAGGYVLEGKSKFANEVPMRRNLEMSRDVEMPEDRALSKDETSKNTAALKDIEILNDAGIQSEHSVLNNTYIGIQDDRDVQGGRILQGDRAAEGGRILQDSRNAEGGRILQGDRDAESGRILQGDRNAEGGRILQDGRNAEGGRSIQDDRDVQGGRILQDDRDARGGRSIQDGRNIQDDRDMQHSTGIQNNGNTQDYISIQNDRRAQDNVGIQNVRNVQDSMGIQNSDSEKDRISIQNHRSVQDSKGLQNGRSAQNHRSAQNVRSIQNHRSAQVGRSIQEDRNFKQDSSYIQRNKEMQRNTIVLNNEKKTSSMDMRDKTNLQRHENISVSPTNVVDNTSGQVHTDTVRASRKSPQTIIITEEMPRSPREKSTATQYNIADYNLKEDKWEQILDTYEQIHPYGDERVYVKLEPKDFVILQSNYQHLVNNSFLLHGFYNYRYLILGKEGDYYLGVPGVFYEREKMVALMFGFEAFECPGGVARAGEFGYYLRKVEL